MRYTNPRLLYYSWSTLRMCSVCRRRSVVRPSVRCLSGDHISKTEQVRPIVTMEQCPEVATVDSVAHSRPAKMPSWGDILVSNFKKISSNTASCSTWCQARAVVIGVRPSELIVNNRRQQSSSVAFTTPAV